MSDDVKQTTGGAPSREALSAERLFERHFAPLYPREPRGAGGGLVDLAALRSTDANPAKNPAIYEQIDDIAKTFARLAPKVLADPTLELDFSDASVHRLAQRITRERRDGWLDVGRVVEPPLLVTVVTHGAIYVGACVVKQHGGVWQVRRPLWESLVRLESRAGTADLALFQWWLKALSDDEIDHGRLADRYRTHVEVPTFDPGGLPIIAPPDRRLPRLAKVRYDTLHKHLRAHLPELRDLGADFPSPERFAEMGFQWLEFVLLGEGRMLLLHGPAEGGVHLLWLDAGGFVKAAFYPADSFPAHVVQTDGDKIRVVVPIQSKTAVHEMLWWGV